MAPRLPLLLALTFVAAAGPASADKLTLALFAPSATFESGEARFSFVSQLAQHLSAQTALDVEGKAFARAADFEAAVRKGQVDLAIVDGVYLAERGVPWEVLAVCTTNGELSARWVLIAADAGGVLDLAGRKLALAASGGRDNAFIDNVLLDGELPKLFGERQATPDVASAAAAVALHKADAAFVPDALARSQHRVFDAGRVPNPALVVVRASLPRATRELLRGATLTAAGNALYDGWRAGGAEPYRALAARLSARTRRPVMAEPPLVALDPAELLVLPPLSPSLPELRSQFFAPPGRP